MDDFGARGAPLEYWFVKVGGGDLAFLVDWIVRRLTGRAEIRISLWVRGRGRVVRAQSTTWRVGGSTVAIAGCTFTPTASAGAVEDVRWELRCAPGRSRLDPVPVPAKLLRPFDLQLVTRPRAQLTGTVEVAGEKFSLLNARGTVSHYWGRRLPDSWIWVSADLLDAGDIVVEAALLRTRLWGLRRPTVIGGYVIADGGGRTARIVAPGYGQIRGGGHVTSVGIRARTLGRQVRLTATAPREAYNDLGEGIRPCSATSPWTSGGHAPGTPAWKFAVIW